MQLLRWIAAVSVIVASLGCAQRYPMGVSEKEWNALTPEQQTEYKSQQDAIDAEKRKQDEENRRQRAAESAAREEAERERRAAFLASLKYGDVVVVSIKDGTFERDGKLYAQAPTSFELTKGDSLSVRFLGQGKGKVMWTNITTQFTPDGTTIRFNAPNRNQCVVLTNDGWDRGQVYRPVGSTKNEEGVKLYGMTITVRCKDMPTAVPQ